MFTKRKTTTGKWLAFIGLWLFAFGFAFSDSIGLEDTPDVLEAASIPLIAVGVVMMLASNFFNRKRLDH
ncbi:hypothetical protein [Halobacillus salinus]|uniref:Uncharacterized protein n=1 Tax=Halobacillus salinus TaxID=192814 RepID=A0A4Z0H2W0_9BACI|nr:hypothetical protein [Halobacillus salinus]TGB03515.1 hypothetical protein E4663_00485 [Halobacillus salinus]